jgi:hypothetical protein
VQFPGCPLAHARYPLGAWEPQLIDRYVPFTRRGVTVRIRSWSGVLSCAELGSHPGRRTAVIGRKPMTVPCTHEVHCQSLRGPRKPVKTRKAAEGSIRSRVSGNYFGSSWRVRQSLPTEARPVGPAPWTRTGALRRRHNLQCRIFGYRAADS